MWRALIACIFGLFLACTGSTVMAHEPLFGVGPHTLFRNGLGLETEIAVEDDRLSIHNEAIYGVTADLAVTLAAPWHREDDVNGAESGLGDISLRGKWRFYRRDFPGGQDALALIFGAKLPTGNNDLVVPLGTGSIDYFGGIAAGRESRRWYYFGDLRYRFNTSANRLKHGNVVFYDVAWGVRPIRSGYDRPDLVLLVEANGSSTGKGSLDGVKNPNTGGRRLSVSPGFLLSLRNVMLKGGVNFPVFWKLNGVQKDPDSEFVMGVEFHL